MMLLNHNHSPQLTSIAKRLFGRITGIEDKSVMLGSTQTQHTKNPELLHSAMATIGLGLAVAADHFAGSHELEHLRQNPDYYVSEQSADNTLVVLPGCQMDGKELFSRLRPHTPDTKLVVTDYPEKGFDIEQICEGLSDTLLSLRAEKPDILCQSMGGIVVRHFFEYANRTGLTDTLNGFGTVILDDPIHDATDIRWAYNGLMRGAIAFQGSWAVDHLKPLFMAKSRGFSTKTHVITAADQGKFILQNHPRGTYDQIIDSSYFIHGPDGDKVARTLPSLLKFRGRFTKLVEVVDHKRERGSHTASDEHFDYMLARIKKQPAQQLLIAA